MKIALLLVALVAVALASPAPSDAIEEQFQQWMRKYHKVYPAQTEYQTRLSIFRSNMAWADELNANEQGTATYGASPFADMSRDEFRARYLGLRQQWPNRDEIPVAADLDVSAAPDSVDWRTQGVVTEVKNQGQCGSCWSFSTTGNVEGQWKLAGNDLVSLSEQQMVDCDKVDQGCNGGLPSNAYEYLIQAGGSVSEADYPYTAADGTCHFDKSKVVAKISNWTAISTDETQIAAYTAAHGPLSIGINAGPMQLYTSGVSNPWFCNPSQLDHGVLIVGYGTDGSKPYWIIKNSWGESWGESGYYRIIRGKGKCGLNTMVTSAIV
jgi:cathepsin F